VGLALLLLALQAGGLPPAPGRPSPEIFSGTASLDVLSDDRQSLRGVTRLFLSLTIAEDLAKAIDADTLQSTLAFSLEQAGLTVLTTREIEDPALVVSIRAVADTGVTGPTPRRLYRIDADLLQLVRLPDLNGGARLMMASTWHAGSFGAVDTIAIPSLRDRAIDVVETFLADWRDVTKRP
jgi:hypothetical protein